MATFKKIDLPSNNFISYVTFSRWDNTAGPSTKCVWIPSSIEPDTANIKLLTRLILKTEVTRDSESTDIDSNMYMLPELSACAVTYLFGAICTLSSKTIYCFTFIYKIEHRGKYLQWSDILDGAIRQDIVKYKALLHKDFEDKCTTQSNSHLNHLVTGVVELLARLENSRLEVSSLRDAGNYFYDAEARGGFLLRVVSSMILSFNRVVVVGCERSQDKINKWVRTLSLLLTPSDRERCFTCGSQDQRFIPNALVQGLLTNEDFLSMKPPVDGCNILSLYTTCAYPLTIVDLAKKKVYLTANHWLHQDHQQKIRETQLMDILFPQSSSLMGKVLDQAKQECTESDNTLDAALVGEMLRQVFRLDKRARLEYIDQYMAYLRSLAMGLIEYLRHECVEPTNTITRAGLEKHLFLSESDLEIVLCIAEAGQPGVYNLVPNDNLESKSKMVNTMI